MSILRLALALIAALAGMWGFFLCAAGYVFQPAQVGPDHGAWGALGGLVLLPVALLLGGIEKAPARQEDWQAGAEGKG